MSGLYYFIEIASYQGISIFAKRTCSLLDTHLAERKERMNHSSFCQRIYEIVADIPEGCVATYGQLAWMAGRPNAPRMAGYAMSQAPEELNLPCHRVVNRKGEMAPGQVFGGEQLQRSLLEQEGITFKENGRIDLEKHLWMPYVP